MEKENDWLNNYEKIRAVFCGRCEYECTESRKLSCIELNLLILEMAEISDDHHRKT